MVSREYNSFLAKKSVTHPPCGLSEVRGDWPHLFPFQADIVRWALKRGRAAIFASTGLGKSRMQLTWASEVVRATGRDVLVLAPLAVAAQTENEGEAIGIRARVARDGAEVQPGITITNYDRLHRFDCERFAGVVLDESSILKSFAGHTRNELVRSFASTPYRLACTATPAPNDFMELGNHAEFLGVRTFHEMLAEYFTHDGGDTSKWRLKGHARQHFWRWVASWGALVRTPSDLGYDDDRYNLPPLLMRHHIVGSDITEARAAGLLFAMEAQTMQERRVARKSSTLSRARACAELVLSQPDEPWIIWCDLNAEADALMKLIPGAVEVRGTDDRDTKEERLIGFARCQFKVLVTKASVAGYGLNWQHCARMAFVGVSDSWEMQYQAIRRCWRFKQERPVEVHLFASEAEGAVLQNIQRKERDAETLAEQLSAQTRDAVRAEVRGSQRERDTYRAPEVRAPLWLRSEEEENAA